MKAKHTTPDPICIWYRIAVPLTIATRRSATRVAPQTKTLRSELRQSDAFHRLKQNYFSSQVYAKKLKLFHVMEKKTQN